MNLGQVSPTEIASAERLKTLENRYRRSRKKIWFGIAIPVLWGVGAIIAYAIGELWAWEALVGWCLLVTFLMGVYVLYQVPATSDVVHNYSQEILPGLFRKTGAENVRVNRRHDLSMKTFLEAGLYYEKYSTISREDVIQGKFTGRDFAMYEIAIQTTSGTTPGVAQGVMAPGRTNQFYGWFILAESNPIAGFHFITLRKRINSGESDDWHVKTVSHWEKDAVLQKVFIGNTEFDDLFLLNSDRPEVLRGILNSSAQEFLVHLAKTASNSFAISIQRSQIYFLIGHENAQFRKCPDGNFLNEIHPEMRSDVKWFVDAIKGLQKLNL